MKDTKTIGTFLIVIIFMSIAAGYGAGYFVYRDYKQKAAYFDRQARLTMDRFGELEGNLQELYSSLEISIDDSRVEGRRVLSSIESIKENIQEWKKGYNVSMSELRGTIEDMKVDKLTRMVENLQDDIDEFELAVQDLNLKLDNTEGRIISRKVDGESVDLGKISVRKKAEKQK